MCGICGIVMKSDVAPDPEVLARMAARIVHRGPDDEGAVVSGRAAMAARRLSIIDVEGGHQPICNEDGSVWCALNGEIYNHPDLMDRLRSLGHRFRTRCDTEVIVHLYEEYGVGFLDHVDGMFGIAIWDERDDSLLIARDRLGIKPLYYADLSDRLLFGSELKALLPAGLPRYIDLAALDAYFALSFVPAPYSIFQAARKLLPGHYLQWKAGGSIKVTPYWSLPVEAHSSVRRRPPKDEYAEELLRLLRLAVKRHMISDVPLGAFLSGGLDSSAVVALMAEHSSQPVRTFSIGFDERSFDETPHARAIAKEFGTEHHELVQRPEPGVLADTLSWMYDEPFADSSAVATYTVAQLARKHVTVALTGDGGDEVFGGYLLYRADKMAQLYRRLPSWIASTVVPAAANRLPTSDKKASFDYKVKRFVQAASLPPDEAHMGWKTHFTPDVRRQLLLAPTGYDPALALLRGYYQSGPPGDAIGCMLYADTLLSLPDDMLTKVDRATMAVSLEARVPLLDRGVVEFMASLPSALKIHRWELKYLFKRAVAGILPPATMHRKKEGFNIPIARWLRGDLKELMLDVLSTDRVRSMGLLDEGVVRATIEDHISGRHDRARELWSLLSYALWYERYAGADKLSDDLERSSAGSVTAPLCL